MGIVQSIARVLMTANWVREMRIRRTLRALSRQRVALVLKPGKVLVIERAVESTDEEIEASLRTCLIRGWVEVLENALPNGRLTEDQRLPNPLFTDVSPLYRITDSGWSVIHRDRLWSVTAVIFAAASFVIAVLAIHR